MKNYILLAALTLLSATSCKNDTTKKTKKADGEAHAAMIEST